VSVQSIAVDLQLLRAVLLSDVNLTLGRELMARVVSNEPGARGSLSIAGMIIDAELPADLSKDQEVKLQVRELTPERVVLAMQSDEAPAPTTFPPPPGPSPGIAGQGAHGNIEVRERHRSSHDGQGPEQAAHTLGIRYDAPSAGPVDLYFVLTPDALHVQVTVAAGATFDIADESAQNLGDTLNGDGARTATVTVQPRFDPVDLYA
jgi:hypothetical protein